MATVMRNQLVKRYREPISHARRSMPAGRSSVTAIGHWAAAHPGVTSFGLSVIYLLTLAALVAVLSASALGTPVGAAVGVLFVVEVLAFLAIAVYTVRPEHK